MHYSNMGTTQIKLTLSLDNFKTRLGIDGNSPLAFWDYCPVCSLNCRCSNCKRKANILGGELKKVCLEQNKTPSEAVFPGVLERCLSIRIGKRKTRKRSFEDELVAGATGHLQHREESKYDIGICDSNHEMVYEKEAEKSQGSYRYATCVTVSENYHDSLFLNIFCLHGFGLVIYSNTTMDVDMPDALNDIGRSLTSLVDICSQSLEKRNRELYQSEAMIQQEVASDNLNPDPYKYYCRAPPKKMAISFQQGLINDILLKSRAMPAVLTPQSYNYSTSCKKSSLSTLMLASASIRDDKHAFDQGKFGDDADAPSAWFTQPAYPPLPPENPQRQFQAFPSTQQKVYPSPSPSTLSPMMRAQQQTLPTSPTPQSQSEGNKVRFRDYQVKLWTTRFRETKEFREKHGHCKPEDVHFLLSFLQNNILISSFLVLFFRQSIFFRI